MKSVKMTVGILFILLLAGCGNKDKDTIHINYSEGSIVGMEGNAPDLSYAVEHMSPGVLVNQVGYESQGQKEILFKGEGLGTMFWVVESDTKKVVYTGIIEGTVYDKILDEYVSYGDFTDFTVPGRYYIRTDVIGESYPFEIGENSYHKVFDEICMTFRNTYEEMGSKAYSEGCVQESGTSVANLLISYELYPGLFEDDLGIAESGNDIPDILDEVRFITDWYLEFDQEQMDGDSLSCYAGILSQYSQLYKQYDSKYANSCLQAAEKAYARIDKTKVKDVGAFYFAVVELYKATSNSKYHKEVQEYLQKNLEKESIPGFELYGDIGYLTGKSGINMELCGKLMDRLLNKTEKIAAKANGNAYLVCSNVEEELLEAMQYVAISDYAITNHEYVTVQENHLHFFLGRNTLAYNYLESGLETEISKSKFIFMMCEVLESATENSTEDVTGSEG